MSQRESASKWADHAGGGKKGLERGEAGRSFIGRPYSLKIIEAQGGRRKKIERGSKRAQWTPEEEFGATSGKFSCNAG